MLALVLEQSEELLIFEVKIFKKITKAYYILIIDFGESNIPNF